MAAAVLFTDAAGRALLVNPIYKDYWEIVGGAVDADESPRQAAAREVKEEIDLAVVPGRLLAVDWVPPRPGRTEGVMYVYDGGTLTDADLRDVHLPPDELSEWAWCSVEEIGERMSELLARRITAALAAKATGATVELENGFQVM